MNQERKKYKQPNFLNDQRRIERSDNTHCMLLKIIELIPVWSLLC